MSGILNHVTCDIMEVTILVKDRQGIVIIMNWKLKTIFFLLAGIAIGGAIDVNDDVESRAGAVLAATDLSFGSGGTIYYVSPQGNDTNPGTEALPFRTIQRAADVVQAGNLVFVKAGTYSDFSVTRSGSPGQPIVFRAYPGEKPIIRGSRTDGVILINESSYIIIDGINVDGGGLKIQIQGAKSAYNQILNCELSHGGAGIGIYYGAHDNLVKNCRIHDTINPWNWPRGSTTLRGDCCWGAAVIVAHGALNNVFEENYIYWNHGEGVANFNAAHGTVWRHNIIADNWSVNLYIDGSKDVIIDGNLIYLTSEGKSWPTVDPNKPNKSNSLGIGVSVECAGSANCYYPDWGERAVTGLTATNNIVVNANGGLWAFRNDGSYVASGWLVANNTFINNDVGIRVAGIDVQQSEFRNNIVIQNNSGDAVEIQRPGPNTIFSNNLYFAIRQQAFRWGTTVTDFTGWKGLSSDANSLWSDPRLQDTSAIPPRFWSDPTLPSPSPILPIESIAEAYKLTANSPAIDAGVAISGFNTDRDGTPRPLGNGWDIGAFEFGGKPSLQTYLKANPTSGKAPLTVQFNGSASGGKAPYNYSWNFGDGNTSTQQNPTHTYTQAKSYTTTLTVTDSDNKRATASQAIVVEASSGNEPSVVNMKFTKVDQTEELSSITPGEWHDLYLYVDDSQGWNDISYADVWLSHESNPEGTISNRGGRYFAASNYVMSYSIASSTIWAKETEGTTTWTEVSGKLGLYVDDDNNEYAQDSNQKWTKARIKLLPSAQVGNWKLNAYVIDKEGHISNLFQKNIRVSTTVDQTPPSPPQNVKVSNGSP
jgi:PKD repeat protein